MSAFVENAADRADVTADVLEHDVDALRLGPGIDLFRLGDGTVVNAHGEPVGEGGDR